MPDGSPYTVTTDRRELLRDAWIKLHRASDAERHLMHGELVSEAASLLRRAGEPELADECEGGDLVALMREIGRRE